MPILEHAGAALYYEVTDLVPRWRPDPETLLFHHGLGLNADIWAEWIPRFADRYRIVRFDMRGCGRSSVPEPGYAWSFAGLADDILAIARATKSGPRFHLIGESLGGIMGYYLAIKHREALRSVVAVSANHQGPRIGGNVRDWRALIDQHGMAAWSEGMLESRFFPGAIDAHYRAFLHAMQLASSARVIVEVSGGLLRPMDLRSDLAEITTPLLLLVGEASPFVTVETLLDIRAQVPHAALHVIAGARHGVVMSHPAACCAAVAEFLERRVP